MCIVCVYVCMIQGTFSDRYFEFRVMFHIWTCDFSTHAFHDRLWPPYLRWIRRAVFSTFYTPETRILLRMANTRSRLFFALFFLWIFCSLLLLFLFPLLFGCWWIRIRALKCHSNLIATDFSKCVDCEISHDQHKKVKSSFHFKTTHSNS